MCQPPVVCSAHSRASVSGSDVGGAGGRHPEAQAAQESAVWSSALQPFVEKSLTCKGCGIAYTRCSALVSWPSSPEAGIRAGTALMGRGLLDFYLFFFFFLNSLAVEKGREPMKKCLRASRHPWGSSAFTLGSRLSQPRSLPLERLLSTTDPSR